MGDCHLRVMSHCREESAAVGTTYQGPNRADAFGTLVDVSALYAMKECRSVILLFFFFVP